VDDDTRNGKHDCFCDGEKYFLVVPENGVVRVCCETDLMGGEIMSQVDIPLSNISDLEYLGSFPSPPYFPRLMTSNNE